MDDTKRIILKLFARYPSLATASVAQTAAMTAAYLEALRGFSSPAVSAACDAIRAKGSAFPPSADELFVECQKRADAERKARDWGGRTIDFDRYRLAPPPKPSPYTPEELADWRLIINGSGPYVARVDANGAPLTIPAGYPGAGTLASYGYLTPAEASDVRGVDREAAE